MPGQSARRYSGHVTILTVGGEDLLGTYRDVNFFVESETQESRAAQDDWEYPVGHHSRWGIDLNRSVEDDGDDLYVLLSGAPVAIIFESSSVDGINVTGNALLTRVGLDIPDSGGQANDLRLVGQGQPTIVTST